jgi:hypothetical protein
MPLPPARLIRRAHMYLALFLTPWMIIYALSGLVLNHLPTIRGWYGGNIAPFEKVGEREYTAAFSADADPLLIGEQILTHLDLLGTFRVQGRADQPRLVINRNGAFAAHRITYFRTENRLLIEKQVMTAPAFVNRVHFRHGFDQPFLSSRLWGVIVDLVVVAMVFWGLSGIWMWWETRPARGWGAACALLGSAVFGLLLYSL